jgi:hypothetical protein
MHRQHGEMGEMKIKKGNLRWGFLVFHLNAGFFVLAAFAVATWLGFEFFLTIRFIITIAIHIHIPDQTNQVVI